MRFGRPVHHEVYPGPRVAVLVATHVRQIEDRLERFEPRKVAGLQVVLRRGQVRIPADSLLPRYFEILRQAFVEP